MKSINHLNNIYFYGLNFILVSTLFIIIYSPYIFSDDIPFYFNDIFYQWLPDYKLLTNSLKDGFLPLWSDKFGSGFPVGSYGYNAYFHPINLLVAYIFEDLKIGVLVLFYLSLIIGMTSMYFALKLINIDNIYILIGVLVYLGSFHFMPIGVFYPLQMAYMFSPLILLLFYKTITEPNNQTTLILGLVGGISLLSFYPAYQIRFFGALFLVSIVYIIISHVNKKQKFISLFLSILIMFIIVYPQIKLTYELLSVSLMNKNPDSYYYFMSINFSTLLHIFGNLYFTDLKEYTDAGWIYFKLPNIFVYLAIFSLFYKDKKIVYFLWALMLLSFFLALGENNPFYRFLVENNLVFNQRIPARFLLLLNFIIPILSVFGLIHIVNNIKDIKKYLYIVVSIFTIYLINLIINISDFKMNFILDLDFTFVLLVIYFISKIYYGSKITLLYTKNFHYLLIVTMIINIVYPGHSITKKGIIKKNEIFKKYEFLDDIHKVYSLVAPRQSMKNITSEMNIFYGVDSANIYAQALRIKDYTLFISDIRKKILDKGDISQLLLLGVDGLFSYKLLDLTYPVEKIEKNLYLYKLPYYGNIWGYEKNSFNTIEIIQSVNTSNDLKYKVKLKKEQDIVIFRNRFYYFDVYLDGQKIVHDKYYSFYKLNNITSGEHTIEIKFSLYKMLFSFGEN